MFILYLTLLHYFYKADNSARLKVSYYCLVLTLHFISKYIYLIDIHKSNNSEVTATQCLMLDKYPLEKILKKILFTGYLILHDKNEVVGDKCTRIHQCANCVNQCKLGESSIVKNCLTDNFTNLKPKII